MGSKVICPECGYVIELPVTMENVSFSGNRLNVPVNCPRCREVWDAFPGDDVTVSTDPQTGLLRRVAPVVRHLVSSDRGTLEELREEVQRIKAGNDTAAAEQLLVRAGAGSWLGQQANRMELWALLQLLASVITIVLMLRPADPPPTVTPADLNHMITKVVQLVEAENAHPPSHVSVRAHHDTPAERQEPHRHPDSPQTGR